MSQRLESPETGQEPRRPARGNTLSTIGTAPHRARAWLTALALVALASAARASGPGPAYFVEPGDAPRGSTEPDPAEPAAPEPSATTDVAAPGTPFTPDGETEAVLAPEATAPVVPSEVPGESPPANAPSAEPTPRPPAPLPADDDPRALAEFGNRLSPYGTWVEDPSYGQVWLPDPSIVGKDFAPYLTNGHWAVDASGAEAWASDYPFGDVVFHYGRWVWTAAGWAWIPGYRYAPAWVAWRMPTDAYAYVGWSPLPPSFVWVRGAPMSLAWHSAYYWVFCPSSFVLASTPSLYVVRTAADARSLARHTRVVVPEAPRRGPPAGIVTRVPKAGSFPHGAPVRALRPAAARQELIVNVNRAIKQSRTTIPATNGAHRTRR